MILICINVYRINDRYIYKVHRNISTDAGLCVLNKIYMKKGLHHNGLHLKHIYSLDKMK